MTLDWHKGEDLHWSKAAVNELRAQARAVLAAADAIESLHREAAERGAAPAAAERTGEADEPEERVSLQALILANPRAGQ